MMLTATLASAVLAMTVPLEDPEWYQQRADSDFLLYLSQSFGSADEISEAPYCTVSDGYETANCQALVDGQLMFGVGTFNGTNFADWEDPSAVATSAVATTVPDYSAEIEEAAAEIEGDTEITRAVIECLPVSFEANVESGHSPDTQRFVVMDDGHSVRIEDFAEESDDTLSSPRVECLAERLGLPQWIFVQMAMTDGGTIDVPGYSVSWAYSGENFAASVFLIYDDTVGGGQSID
jgi:hypothetical protein